MTLQQTQEPDGYREFVFRQALQELVDAVGELEALKLAEQEASRIRQLEAEK